MTDTDARLRDRLRWAIHALLVVGLALVLGLVTVVIASGAYHNDPTYALGVIAATWGFFVVYAGGTTFLVAWKTTTWLHALLVHVAAVGSIFVGALVIVGGLIVFK